MAEETAVELIVGCILDGEADGQFREIVDAIKRRQVVLNEVKSMQFRAKDKVIFNDSARPTFMQGVRGYVKTTRGRKVDVVLDEEAEQPWGALERAKDRFGGTEERPIRSPVAIIDKIEEDT